MDPVDLERALEQIEEIYVQLPTVECQGLCWNSCGPIEMSDAERQRIEDAGVHIQPYTWERSQLWAQNVVEINGERLQCAALTPMHRCAVYEIRPLICRAFGVGRGPLACEHGCRVTGRRLKAEEVLDLLMQTKVVGGGLSEGELEMYQAAREDPQLSDLFRRYLASDDVEARGLLVPAIWQRLDQIRSGRT